MLQRNYEVNARRGYPNFCVRPGDVIGDDIILDGLYEEDLLVQLFSDPLKNYLTRFKNSTALDIGANIGNHSIFFSRFFNNVIAFEPNDTAIHLFKANMTINQITNIELYEMGLGERCLSVPFIEYPNSLGMSHFVDNNLDYQEERKSTSSQIVKDCDIRRGDEVLNDKHLSDLSLVKLDCEGYELSALKGLEKTLGHHRPIILFESCSSEGETGSNAIMSYLSHIGYKHFYKYDWKSKHKILVVLTRMKRELQRIDQTEDRYYSLLIASNEEIAP